MPIVSRVGSKVTHWLPPLALMVLKFVSVLLPEVVGTAGSAHWLLLYWATQPKCGFSAVMHVARAKRVVVTVLACIVVCLCGRYLWIVVYYYIL